MIYLKFVGGVSLSSFAIFTFQILLSIQEEVGEDPDWHLEELNKIQQDLKKGNDKYFSEKDFWDEHANVYNIE